MILKLKSQTGSRKGIQVFCTATMLHDRNNGFFFLWEQMFFLMQKIFIVPAMEHGCRAKSLHQENVFQIPIWEIVSALWTGNLNLTKGEGLDMTS